MLLALSTFSLDKFSPCSGRIGLLMTVMLLLKDLETAPFPDPHSYRMCNVTLSSMWLTHQRCGALFRGLGKFIFEHLLTLQDKGQTLFILLPLFLSLTVPCNFQLSKQ